MSELNKFTINYAETFMKLPRSILNILLTLIHSTSKYHALTRSCVQLSDALVLFSNRGKNSENSKLRFRVTKIENDIAREQPREFLL